MDCLALSAVLRFALLLVSNLRKMTISRVENVCKPLILLGWQKNIKIISTHLLARSGWFCPVASEPVKPYFTRFLRVLTFCLGASKIVILKENGVVNGVVEWAVIDIELHENKG